MSSLHNRWLYHVLKLLGTFALIVPYGTHAHTHTHTHTHTRTHTHTHTHAHTQATLVHSSLDLSKYHNVLLYWRTKCLPPTSTGVLSIMGLLAVQDVSYYLQYYSLPILTAICTPVVKIVVSLRRVYSYH